MKHFAAYGAAEGGRDYNTVDISEQLLREVYLPPFRAAIDAGVGLSVIWRTRWSACHGESHPDRDILRNEWKFPGFVVSDYNSVKELIAHGVAADGAEAALKALPAGVDMSMVDGLYRDHIPELVKSGKLPVSVVDESDAAFCG